MSANALDRVARLEKDIELVAQHQARLERALRVFASMAAGERPFSPKDATTIYAILNGE